MTPDQLAAVIMQAVREMDAEGVVSLTGGAPDVVHVERPKVRDHGDYATNVAMRLAKGTTMAPRELASLLAERLQQVEGIADVDVAGPGFINIRLEASAQGEIARQVVQKGAAYGRSADLRGRRVNLEFVSANPTGPVTLASTRWAVTGDALANLFEAQGAEVVREYYFNDAGAQIDRFTRSLLARAKSEPVPEDGYPGEYVEKIARQVLAKRPDALDLPEDESLEVFRKEGVALMFDEIKASLAGFGVQFDVYFSERTLYEQGAVDKAVERLREGGLTYEADGALWLRSTEYGDDKDRVLVRSDGRPTYICSDAAYYLDKRGRGFDRVVIILGADHHGYVGRYRALAAAFGDDPDEHLELLIGQMVNLLRDGAPVRMGKRTGNVLTLEDLVEAIGVDASRYALARFSADSNLDIDLDLWSRQTSDNPVYYVQYAHARLSSILRNAADRGVSYELGTVDLAMLRHPREGDLLRALGDYPRVVRTATAQRDVHLVARYLESVAASFHKFFDACRVLPADGEEATDLHRARLLLVDAARVVFVNGLGLLGITAPERM